MLGLNLVFPIAAGRLPEPEGAILMSELKLSMPQLTSLTQVERQPKSPVYWGISAQPYVSTVMIVDITAL